MTTKLGNVIDKALYSIASGQTITATAKECGISRQTLSDAINNDMKTYNKLQSIRTEMNEGATDKLRSLYQSAIEYLQKAFDDDDIAQQQKIQIALSIIKTPIANFKPPHERGLFDFAN